ncbi:TPA: hypothetical protein I4G93_20625 [Enterobacter hormaechei subsp. xiangfangensis]|nr:hypothetical protein [Enterobacter hormaechei subsp. xiangfangensis]HAS1822485.1 hypothetical protein [Enterobacter hormaechei subsp. xiangfangensis]HAS1827959.1 hypothetical protein [Enterobacter hormaechei subsp. xiangfangensis]HAS1867742.1 hypothetical protein [Enterobacter hormaechei subsp. xiangfangensis]HAS1872909.1 hypothetical protein [Enterobacter hormaechei subsp. xiangfangensis]
MEATYATAWKDCNQGMTLRDYFAAKALQSVSLALDKNEQALIAAAAYAQADAMLRAREAS